jgi:hypothetical protein
MTQKIRVVTSYGGWFDMDKPPDFQLPQYVQSIRAAGYMLNDMLYVPHEHVVTIFTFDSEAPPPMPPSVSTMGSGSGTLQ